MRTTETMHGFDSHSLKSNLAENDLILLERMICVITKDYMRNICEIVKKYRSYLEPFDPSLEPLELSFEPPLLPSFDPSFEGSLLLSFDPPLEPVSLEPLSAYTAAGEAAPVSKTTNVVNPTSSFLIFMSHHTS